jgi:hypothetical protein
MRLRTVQPPPTMSTWQTRLAPRRDWHGRQALVPLETCSRILELYSWSFALMGTIAVVFVGVLYRHLVAHVPAFWVAAGAVVLQWCGAICRGLPFPVRYGIFAGNCVVFLVSTVVVMAITPN